MDRSGTIRIQAEAAKALAGWKAFFAEQVGVKAKELATDSNPPSLITLDHYRRAAILELIDCDIQGTLSAAQQIELAGLTQLMREQVGQ